MFRTYAMVNEIFSDTQRAERALTKFIGIPNEPCEDVFEPHDHPALLSKMIQILDQEPNSVLPYRLVSLAIVQLHNSTQGLQLKWMNIVLRLNEILQQYEDEEILTCTLRTLITIPSVSWHVYFTLLTHFPTWSGKTKRWAAALMHCLLNYKLEEEEEEIDVVLHTACIFPDLIRFYNESTTEETHLWSCALLLERIIGHYVISQRGLELISCSGLIGVLHNMLREQETDVNMTRLGRVYTIISNLSRDSNELYIEMLDSGFSTLLANQIPSLWEVIEPNLLRNYVDVFIEFAKKSAQLSDETCFNLTMDAVRVFMTCQRYEVYLSELRNISDEVILKLICTIAPEVFSRMLNETPLVAFLSGSIMHCDKKEITERVIEIIKCMCATHPMLVGERFRREGVVESLRKAMVESLRKANTIVDLDLSWAFNLLNTKHFKSRIDKIVNKIDRAFDTTSKEEESLLEILREIHTTDSQVQITGYEFLQLDIVGMLLRYITSSENTSTPTSRKRSISFTEQESLSEVEQLNARLIKFIQVSTAKNHDITKYILTLVKILGRAIYFVDFCNLKWVTQSIWEPDHQCTINPHIQGIMSCVLKNSDPRHDLFLLLAMLDIILSLIPKVKANAVAEYLCNESQTHRYVLAVQEYAPLSLLHLTEAYRVTSYRILMPISRSIDMQYFGREASAHKDGQVITTYPFIFPPEFRKRFIEAVYKIGNDTWDKPIRDLEVDKSNLLQSGYAALLQHSSLQTDFRQLRIHYANPTGGEIGVGAGPTVSFYEQMMNELKDPCHGMWREPTELPLFPRPYQESDQNLEDVIEKFKMLGLAMSTAFSDGYLLDINLSEAFYKLAVHTKDLTPYDIFSFDKYLGSTILELESLLRTSDSSKRVRNDDGEMKCRGMDLEDLCLPYEVPRYKDYKLTTETDKTIEPDNLEQYLDDVLDATLKSGVMKQISAFREGFGNLIKSLLLFAPHEIHDLLCGRDCREPWTREELVEGLVFEFDSDPSAEEQNTYKEWIYEILLEFDLEKRKAFMDLVCATTRVPKSGLKALNPKMTMHVFRKGYTGDHTLPSSQTCFNLLKLPFYTTKETLKARILKSMELNDGTFGLV